MYTARALSAREHYSVRASSARETYRQQFSSAGHVQVTNQNPSRMEDAERFLRPDLWLQEDARKASRHAARLDTFGVVKKNYCGQQAEKQERRYEQNDARLARIAATLEKLDRQRPPWCASFAPFTLLGRCNLTFRSSQRRIPFHSLCLLADAQGCPF